MKKNKLVAYVKDEKNRKKIVILVLIILISGLLWKYVVRGGVGASSGSDGGSNTRTDVANIGQYPVITGEIVPRKLTYGYYGHMQLEISGSSENWTISDLATEAPPAGYQNWYFVNSNQIIKIDGQLTGFSWQCNDPITIEKCRVRNGTASMYNWGTDEPGLHDEQLGNVFSQNVSCAFTTFIFNRV